MFPEVIQNLQKELKYWHEELYHLHPKYMFRLEKLGFPTSIFIDLKDDVPLCESYMFGTSRISKWIAKGSK